MKGKTDPNAMGCMLVRSDPSFRPIYRAPQGTVYRYDRKTRRVVSMVTVMPDKSQVAWDTCGGCQTHVSKCVCKYGILAPRAIDVIHDKTVAVMGGERWEDVEVKKRSYSMPRDPSTIPVVRHIKRPPAPEGPVRHVKGMVQQPVKKAPTRSIKRPAKPVRHINKPMTNGHKTNGMDLRHIDMNVMDNMATLAGEEATDQLVRHITGTKTDTTQPRRTRHIK